jgi:hypothetical protein
VIVAITPCVARIAAVEILASQLSAWHFQVR